MSFKSFATVECLLACPTVSALAFRPLVLHTLEPDVARVAGEALDNRVLACGALRAIHAAPRQKTRKIRNSDAEHLLGQDVIDALLKVWYLAGQSLRKAAGDLAQKHARLGARVEECH